MATILNDTTKFLKIGDLSFDDTRKLEIKLQKRFLELFKKKSISRKVYKLICSNGSQRPKMYGLIKIHKSTFTIYFVYVPFSKIFLGEMVYSIT